MLQTTAGATAGNALTTARSAAAAKAMTAAGYSTCLNVADGFEGPLDAQAKRGASAGWKAAGLPWRQT